MKRLSQPPRKKRHGGVDRKPPSPLGSSSPHTPQHLLTAHPHSSQIGAEVGEERERRTERTSGPRVALYIRVSTIDQNPQLQFDELRDYCERRGWQRWSEFVDQGITGAHMRRPGLTRLFEGIHRHEYDVVVVWRIDRLGRSMQDLVRTIETFEAQRVEFISVRNPGLDTTTPTGKLFLGIISAFSQFERDSIIERTRAGIAAARARGKKLGRPLANLDVDSVHRLRTLGLSCRQIAKACHVSKTLISDILRSRVPDSRKIERDE